MSIHLSIFSFRIIKFKRCLTNVARQLIRQRGLRLKTDKYKTQLLITWYRYLFVLLVTLKCHKYY